MIAYLALAKYADLGSPAAHSLLASPLDSLADAHALTGSNPVGAPKSPAEAGLESPWV